MHLDSFLCIKNFYHGPVEYWDFHAINFWIPRFVIIILQYSRKSKTKENGFPVLVVVSEVTRRPVLVMSSVKMITIRAQWTTYVAALALKVGWMLAGQAFVESL